jgi:hypothetical protein
MPAEEPALRQAPQADAGVQRGLGGDAGALQFLQDALDLVGAELGPQHRRQPRVRQQVGGK